jgi:hypothetical protein
MKVLTVIMALIPAIALGQWGDMLVADTVNWQTNLSTTEGYLDLDSTYPNSTYWDIQIWEPTPVKHDTLKEYPTDIKEVCDTVWTKSWMPFKKIEGTQYFKQMTAIDTVRCRIDTTWADKTPVWLEPDEYEKLMDWLR